MTAARLHSRLDRVEAAQGLGPENRERWRQLTVFLEGREPTEAELDEMAKHRVPTWEEMLEQLGPLDA